jgi:hypothetical protein
MPSRDRLIEPKLIPRNCDGSELAWARGELCMMYHHPDDAYPLPIFNNVSLAFIANYIQARPEFFRSTIASGWQWDIVPALESEGDA